MVGTAEIKELAKQVVAGEQEVIEEIKARQRIEEEEVEAKDGEGELDYLEWLQLIDEHGFPDKLIITVLIESDEDNPYKEGSHDAGPVVKGVVDWMMGE